MFSQHMTRSTRVLTLLLLPLSVLSIALFASPKKALGSSAPYVNPDFENNVFVFETTTKDWKARVGGKTSSFELISAPPVLESFLDYENMDVTWYLYDAADLKLGVPNHPQMMPGGVYEGRITIKIKPEVLEKEWSYNKLSDNTKGVFVAFVNGNRHPIEYIDSGTAEDEIPYFTISVRHRVPGEAVGAKIRKYNQSGLDIGKRSFILTHQVAGTSRSAYVSDRTGKVTESFIRDYRDGIPEYHRKKLLRRNLNTIGNPADGRYSKYNVRLADAFAVSEVFHLQDRSQDKSDRETVQALNSYKHVPLLRHQDTSEYYIIRHLKSHYDGVGRHKYTKYRRDIYTYAYNRMIFKGWAIPEAGYIWDFDALPTAHVNNFSGDHWMWSENPYGKAHWEFAYKEHGGKQVFVKFDSQGGSYIEPIKMKSTDTFAKAGGLPTPTKKHFKFKYWKGGYGPHAKIVVDTDAPGHYETDQLAQTLVAHWEPAGDIDATVTWRLPDKARGHKIVHVHNSKIGNLAGYPPNTQGLEIRVFGDPRPYYVAGWEFSKGFEPADFDYMVTDTRAVATAIIVPMTKVTESVKGLEDKVYYLTPGEPYWIPEVLINHPALNYGLEGWNWYVKKDGRFKKQPNHWDYPNDLVPHSELRLEGDIAVRGYDVRISKDSPDSPYAEFTWTKDTDEVDQFITDNVPKKEGYVFSHYDIYADKNFDRQFSDDEKINSEPFYQDLEGKIDSDLYGWYQEYPLLFVANYKEAGPVKINYYHDGALWKTETLERARSQEIGDRLQRHPTLGFKNWVERESGLAFTASTVLIKPEYTVDSLFDKPEPPYPLEFIFYDGKDEKGGGIVKQVTVPSNQHVSPPGVTREGYQFVGWERKDSGPIVQLAEFTKEAKEIFGIDDKELKASDSPVSLVAVWQDPNDEAAPNAYKVIFDTDGGQYQSPHEVSYTNFGEPANGNYNVEGTDDIFTNPPKKSGFKLKGYMLNGHVYTSEEGISIPADQITGDIVMKAVWTEDPEANKFTVTFKPSNGAEDITEELFEDELINTPEVTKEGHTLVGWIDSSDNTLWVPGLTATSDITFVALWNQDPAPAAEPITVTYDVDGGTPEVDAVTTKVGLTAPYPGAVTKEGFVCVGWKNVTDNQTWDFTTPLESDLTLQAI